MTKTKWKSRSWFGIRIRI